MLVKPSLQQVNTAEYIIATAFICYTRPVAAAAAAAATTTTFCNVVRLLKFQVDTNYYE